MLLIISHLALCNGRNLGACSAPRFRHYICSDLVSTIIMANLFESPSFVIITLAKRSCQQSLKFIHGNLTRTHKVQPFCAAESVPFPTSVLAPKCSVSAPLVSVSVFQFFPVSRPVAQKSNKGAPSRGLFLDQNPFRAIARKGLFQFEK